MNCVDYLKGDIKNIKYVISKDNRNFLRQYEKRNRTHPYNYRPVLDIKNYLHVDNTSRYHKFIGMLKWAIELLTLRGTTRHYLPDILIPSGKLKGESMKGFI